MKFNFRQAIFILAVFVILAGIHLFITTQNIGLKYKTTDLKIRLNELLSKNRALGSQLAKKENLKNIEKYAREKLGMVYPKKINYIVISKEKKKD
ncbi:MAG: cell division protein FtsL [Candidatus Saganbacteria bacterium]|nr:cell division protein FtsL [Candidatus Saganbacteria bacterium]